MVPSPGRQQAELFVAGVVGVFNDPVGLLLTLACVEIVHGWQLQVMCCAVFTTLCRAIRAEGSGGECYWAVVIQADGFGFFRNREKNSGLLKTCRDYRLQQ